MNKKFLSGFLSHFVLILVSLLSILPFVWLVSTSFKGIDENIFAYPPVFMPKDFTFANYSGVCERVDLMRYFYNSLIVISFIWQVCPQSIIYLSNFLHLKTQF